MTWGRRDDSGAATIVVGACLVLLITVGAGLGAVASLVKAHRQAQSAADLSALAGAQTHQLGGDGCAAAERLALANSGTLITCQLTGEEVSVEVEVVGPSWLGLSADPTASARAGPG